MIKTGRAMDGSTNVPGNSDLRRRERPAMLRALQSNQMSARSQEMEAHLMALLKRHFSTKEIAEL